MRKVKTAAIQMQCSTELQENLEKAEKKMAETVAKCEKYNEEQQKEIDLKVMQLKNKSYEKMDGTVKAIVEYLF